MTRIKLADGITVVKPPKPRHCENWYQRFDGTLYVGRKNPKPATPKQVARFIKVYGY